jgi:hypothetical protein
VTETHDLTVRPSEKPSQSNVRALPETCWRDSKSVTLYPARASAHAALQPAIPPPITATEPPGASGVAPGETPGTLTGSQRATHSPSGRETHATSRTIERTVIHTGSCATTPSRRRRARVSSRARRLTCTAGVVSARARAASAGESLPTASGASQFAAWR